MAFTILRHLEAVIYLCAFGTFIVVFLKCSDSKYGIRVMSFPATAGTTFKAIDKIGISPIISPAPSKKSTALQQFQLLFIKFFHN